VQVKLFVRGRARLLPVGSRAPRGYQRSRLLQRSMKLSVQSSLAQIAVQVWPASSRRLNLASYKKAYFLTASVLRPQPLNKDIIYYHD
jgi:hypothetical protein